MRRIYLVLVYIAVLLCVIGFSKSRAQGIMTPSGYGLWGNTILAGVGGTYPQVYTSEPDAVGIVGFGLLDPNEHIGIQPSVRVLDVSEMNVFSLGFKIHRRVLSGASIAIGGQNILPFSSDFEFDSDLSDSPSSFYLVFSQHLRFYLPYGHPLSNLAFNVGVGTGRFSEKSPRDVAAGRGENGTYVFASWSYQLAPWLRYHLEWGGTNLHTGLSILHTFREAPVAVGLSVGAADLTRYSGDQIRLIAGFGAVLTTGEP